MVFARYRLHAGEELIHVDLAASRYGERYLSLFGTRSELTELVEALAEAVINLPAEDMATCESTVPLPVVEGPEDEEQDARGGEVGDETPVAGDV